MNFTSGMASVAITAQKKSFIKDIFSKCDQMHS